MTYVLPRQNYPFGASLDVYLGHLPDQLGSGRMAERGYGLLAA